MKRIAISIIIFYQVIISVILKNLGLKTECRYPETCSEYTKHAILRHGVIQGSVLGLARVLSCQPFFHIKTNG